MLKERFPMGQQFVQATIEIVFLRQTEILLQQIGHGAVAIPVPMQPPLAARIDQPIAHQGLQDVPPIGSLSRIGQSLFPELFQMQLLPEPAGHPAGTPLPRTAQHELIEFDLHPIVQSVRRNAALGRIERQFRRLLARRVEDLDHLRPGGVLAVIDLPQVEHVSLHPTAPGATHFLSDAPIAVIFAVFESVVAVQKWFAHSVA